MVYAAVTRTAAGSRYAACLIIICYDEHHAAWHCCVTRWMDVKKPRITVAGATTERVRSNGAIMWSLCAQPSFKSRCKRWLVMVLWRLLHAWSTVPLRIVFQDRFIHRGRVQLEDDQDAFITEAELNVCCTLHRSFHNNGHYIFAHAMAEAELDVVMLTSSLLFAFVNSMPWTLTFS